MTLGARSFHTKGGITIVACTTGLAFLHEFHRKIAGRLSGARLQFEDPFMTIVATEILVSLVSEYAGYQSNCHLIIREPKLSAE